MGSTLGKIGPSNQDIEKSIFDTIKRKPKKKKKLTDSQSVASSELKLISPENSE